jgi:modulator of FtsH protease
MTLKANRTALMNLVHPSSELRATAAGPSLSAALATNKVLRDTYLLLAMTLAFSAVSAAVSMAMKLPHPGLIVTLIGYFGLLFLTARFRDSALGVAFVFALTGFMGYTLGPILNLYLGLAHGPQTVLTALAGTAARNPPMKLKSLRLLAAGILVAFLAGLASAVLELPALSLAVSAAFVLLMAGLVLYETDRIVRGGETNYILATVTLYVSIFNLFTSLLHLLGFAGDGD